MKKILNRIVEVKMVHIGLRCWWSWLDVVYVITGKVL